MFDNLINDMLKEGAEIPAPKKETISLLQSPVIYPNVYREKLVNISVMEEEDLFNILNESLEIILDNLFTENKDENNDIHYFQNIRFINTLINVVARRNIDIKYIIYLNNIIGQYFSCSNVDPIIAGAMKELIKVLDRQWIERLMSLGIDIENSIAISMEFLKSNDDLSNIVRANKVIVNLPKRIATEQNIIFIYEIFADSGLIRMTNLFKSVMYDYGINIVGKDQNEIFSIMINAILRMLNVQSISTIRIVLIEYTKDYLYSNRAIRFPIRTLCPEDFDRILFVVNNLVNENIIVP